MRTIDEDKAHQARELLASGRSVRGVAGLTGLHRNTVKALLGAVHSAVKKDNVPVHNGAVQNESVTVQKDNVPASQAVTVPDYTRISSTIDKLERLLTVQSGLSPFTVQEALEPTRYELALLRTGAANQAHPQPVTEVIAVHAGVDPLALLLG